jgi:thiamine phosphate synthase YjbQ (UPF0047 family)
MRMGMEEEKRLETTLGDLIEALTEEATPFAQDEEEANQMVAHILADLLHRSVPISTRWH